MNFNKIFAQLFDLAEECKVIFCKVLKIKQIKNFKMLITGLYTLFSVTDDKAFIKRHCRLSMLTEK